ncbi:MAG TPA: hypothetical protein VG937_39985, partial [Polyangiaceae bacterium]|nr:hypothetical protein [Polyangiaceae bacterium]
MSEKRPPGPFEIPDLELDVPPARPAPTASERPKGLEFDGPNDDFELETALGSLGSLGLDTESPPMSAAKPRALGAAAPWPTGATPDAGGLQLELEEIER